MQHRTMTTLREKVINIGERVVCYARHILFRLAEVTVSWELFAAFLWRLP